MLPAKVLELRFAQAYVSDDRYRTVDPVGFQFYIVLVAV